MNFNAKDVDVYFRTVRDIRIGILEHDTKVWSSIFEAFCIYRKTKNFKDFKEKKKKIREDEDEDEEEDEEDEEEEEEEEERRKETILVSRGSLAKRLLRRAGRFRRCVASQKLAEKEEEL
ncbi:hypothetical protein V1477_012508 [Vespula maculifrons]|uniref:Uncharacterized protein n=1 Tax=Vespula maculifrons TaxID=7453 RepID=A0ABD2BXP9_VESMC